jgi:cysteine sulfinate desulfinase/cysteine desulfurase-like protein
LVALGFGREWVFGALRLTFGRDNSPTDADALLAAIPPLVVGARPHAMAAV